MLVVLGSPEFNFSVTLVNSQLVCLRILNLVMLNIYLSLFVDIGPEIYVLRSLRCHDNSTYVSLTVKKPTFVLLTCVLSFLATMVIVSRVLEKKVNNKMGTFVFFRLDLLVILINILICTETKVRKFL